MDEKVGLSDTGVFLYFRLHMDGKRLADVTQPSVRSQDVGGRDASLYFLDRRLPVLMLVADAGSLNA